MRYQIWNGTDSIITPSGAQFTAREWAERYPWVKLPGAKMIITAGLINGGAAMEYAATVEQYRKAGAAIADGMTEEEVLAAIEAFEDNPPGADEPGPEERIAAALEAQVLLSEPEAVSAFAAAPARARSAGGGEEARSAAFQRVKRNYDRGLWSAALVQAAAEKRQISETECAAILEDA